MLQDRFQVSQRRACRIVGQHRSTQRREVTRGKGDDALRARMHEFSRKHMRWGYAKLTRSSESGDFRVATSGDFHMATDS